MMTLNLIVSPLARRSLRALMPMGLLAGLSIGLAMGVETAVQVPAQERLTVAKAAYDEARRAQGEYRQIRRTEETLASTWEVLTSRKAFPSLILAVTDLAQREGVAIPGMGYTLQSVENGLATKATMSFQVAGEYAAVRRFIYRLETDRHYLAVESLDASRLQKRLSSADGKESVIEQVRFNIRVMTFLKHDAPITARST